MNVRIQRICAALLAAATLCLFNGCALTGGSASRQLKETRTEVDWAMVRYQNRQPFAFGVLAEEQLATDAYKDFQIAFNEAVRQAHSDYTSATPDNVQQMANQLLALLSTVPTIP